MSIYITADTHFGHKNIVKFCENRVFDSVEEHDEALIKNWNAKIGPKDTVYHLGDFAWCHHKQYLDRLNGKIHLCIGNHDKPHIMHGLKFESIFYIQTLKYMKQKIIMCHYPMMSWDSSFHGSYHVFGHCHGNCDHPGRAFDIGVDCWDCKPLHIDEVIDNFKLIEQKMSLEDPKFRL